MPPPQHSHRPLAWQSFMWVEDLQPCACSKLRQHRFSSYDTAVLLIKCANTLDYCTDSCGRHHITVVLYVSKAVNLVDVWLGTKGGVVSNLVQFGHAICYNSINKLSDQ